MSDSGILRRRQEKKAFEAERVIQLQDDEIERLKMEFSILNVQILEKQREIKNTSLVLSNKISELQLSRKNVSSQLNSIRLKEMREHSHNIRNMAELHAAKMHSIQIEYQNKIRDDFVLDSTDFPVSNNVELINTMEELREAAEKVIKRKYEECQKVVSKRLVEMRNNITNYRNREVELRKKIVEARMLLNEAKKLRQIRVSSAKDDLMIRMSDIRFSTQKSQDFYDMQRANFMTEISRIREEEDSKLSGLREELLRKKKKVFKLRVDVEDPNLESWKEVQKATSELDRLTNELDQIHNQSILDEISQNSEIEKLRYKIEEDSSKVADFRRMRAQLLAVNENLKKEIKRLDFMVYGRGGVHQNNERMATFAS